MPYSRRHYRLVSPKDDTFADVTIRFASLCCALAAQEFRIRVFPVITAENFDDAWALQARCEGEYRTEIGIA